VIYRFGVYEFEAGSGQLRKHGRPVALERQPARVLAALLARPGELVTRDELRQAVWGPETHVDFDRGLAYCLSHIRGALGDRSDNPRFVQTFPRRGFTFIAPVVVVPVQPLPAAQAPTVAELLPDAPAARYDVASTPRAMRLAYVLVPVVFVLALLAAVFLATRPQAPILIAVSVFDNETGLPEYDRPVAGLSDLVVTSLSNLAPDRVAVIGNVDVLRRPRNIRNLQAVADGIRADYVLLGQLQRNDQGLRFITHVIRLRDMVHLKANRLLLKDGVSTLESSVVGEFERAVRDHLLTQTGN
jgi:DNA-binding winged helix-turn-helix (wHTH) protein/TolB-like protein